MSASRAVPISGFSLVRNATILDFPLEASLASLLPEVDELVVNVGQSDDDTLDRVHAIGDPRLRIITSPWDRSLGQAMLAAETQRAMSACRHRWGVYIQADEVFAEGSAALVRGMIERYDDATPVEGVLVNYRHFYGGFDTLAANRKWYRREVRAVRLDKDVDVRSYRDAQGFRVGGGHRRIRAVSSAAVLHHYGWARPADALLAKATEDGRGRPGGGQRASQQLPWIPGLRRFTGEHPREIRAWIDAHRTDRVLIGPPRMHRGHLKLQAGVVLERLTGWRPFEFRNYRLVKPAAATSITP